MEFFYILLTEFQYIKRIQLYYTDGILLVTGIEHNSIVVIDFHYFC